MATQERKAKQQQELELWRDWKADPQPKKLEPLLESLQPLVHRKVNQFKAAPVPQAAVHGFANQQVVKALNTYNPEKGTQLGSWVDWHLKKVRSFVVKHQNIGKIPDQRAYNITRFKTAKQELLEELGYLPDSLTLAEHLGWSQAEVGRMETELRKDLVQSKNPEPDTLPELSSSRERDVLRYIHHDLDPEERTVFEYTLGMYGKPKLSATAIAKEMKISLPKVSRIRRRIDEKLRARGV